MTDHEEIPSWQIPRTDAERAALRKVFERETRELLDECHHAKARRRREASHYRTGLGR